MDGSIAHLVFTIVRVLNPTRNDDANEALYSNLPMLAEHNKVVPTDRSFTFKIFANI